jgi:cytochrome c-type biogenesis protein CcmH
MDRDSAVTQYAKGNFKAGKLILLAALLVFGISVAVSVLRQGKSPASPAPEVTSNAVPTLTALGKTAFDGGRYAEAADAFRKATRADPDKAQIWSALGESLVMASKTDPMPPEALTAFRHALAVDPKDARARYFVAVKRDLDGDHAGAIADWLALLNDTPPGAPWEADLRRTIEQVGKINRINVATRLMAVKQPERSKQGIGALDAIPGPSADDLHAAGSIPPSQQRQMAEGMVAKLEAKLQANPRNLDGWIMLMRSRMTLDQPAKATAALRDAVAANPASATRLRQEAEMLGVR